MYDTHHDDLNDRFIWNKKVEKSKEPDLISRDNTKLFDCLHILQFQSSTKKFLFLNQFSNSCTPL